MGKGGSGASREGSSPTFDTIDKAKGFEDELNFKPPLFSDSRTINQK